MVLLTIYVPLKVHTHTYIYNIAVLTHTAARKYIYQAVVRFCVKCGSAGDGSFTILCEFYKIYLSPPLLKGRALSIARHRQVDIIHLLHVCISNCS